MTPFQSANQPISERQETEQQTSVRHENVMWFLLAVK